MSGSTSQKQSGAATAKVVAKFSLPSFRTSTNPFAVLPNIQDIVGVANRGHCNINQGGALWALAMYRNRGHAAIRYPSTLGRSLCPGHKRRASVMSAPHGRLLGQHLRELVRGKAGQGSDHHRDQRVGERGRDQVCNGPAAGAADGWCSEYATSAA